MFPVSQLSSLKKFLRTKVKAHIAVLFTNLFFAGNFSLVKYISPNPIGPFGLNFIRATVCVLLFWMLWLSSRFIRKSEAVNAGFKKEHFWRFVFCGLTGVAINQVLFIKGLTMTSGIHASLLMLCTPLLITLFAFWILKEKLTLLKAVGLLLGVVGATLLITSKEDQKVASLTGDFLIIINAISYTVYFSEAANESLFTDPCGAMGFYIWTIVHDPILLAAIFGC